MKKIYTIFSHGVHADGKELGGQLGIDEDNRLYWNEKGIVTKQKVTLQWPVNGAIILASLSTLTMAIMAVLQFFGCVGR